MDNDNPIVELCVAGMEAEGKGNADQARELFVQAWSQSSNAFDGCIAAHYLARHQSTPLDRLNWNLKALELARQVEDDSADGYLPSLLLNVAHSYEMLGELEEARRNYGEAAAAAAGLPDDGYGRFVKMGIEAGHLRITERLGERRAE